LIAMEADWSELDSVARALLTSRAPGKTVLRVA